MLKKQIIFLGVLLFVIMAVIGNQSFVLKHCFAQNVVVKQQEKNAENETKTDKPPIVISKVRVTKNSAGTPCFYLVVSNQQEKPIDAFIFDVEAFDAYGRQISKFGSGDEVHRCIYQDSIIKQGKRSSKNVYWTLYGFENGYKFKVKIVDCHFTDGGTWTADSQNDSATEVGL